MVGGKVAPPKTCTAFSDNTHDFGLPPTNAFKMLFCTLNSRCSCLQNTYLAIAVRETATGLLLRARTNARNYRCCGTAFQPSGHTRSPLGRSRRCPSGGIVLLLLRRHPGIAAVVGVVVTLPQWSAVRRGGGPEQLGWRRARGDLVMRASIAFARELDADS